MVLYIFFMQSFLAERDPENRFFKSAKVHLHVPEVGVSFSLILIKCH